MRKVHYCDSCVSEFAVSHEEHQAVGFCPFCATALDANEEFEVDDEEEIEFEEDTDYEEES